MNKTQIEREEGEEEEEEEEEWLGRNFEDGDLDCDFEFRNTNGLLLWLGTAASRNTRNSPPVSE